MKCNGMIYYFDLRGNKLDHREYFSRQGRRNIIDEWSEMFGDGYVIIRPKTRVVLQKYAHSSMPYQEKVNIIRPPAIYDNVKSLYSK